MMTVAEALQTTRIDSVAGLTGARTTLVTARPLHAPHHTISDVGVTGVGEVSLTHPGVRFIVPLPRS